MGCSSCGTNTGGKPNGCKSNGGCSTGGCNRMNVHDWLTNLPIADADTTCRIVEVSFNKGSRKDFFRNTTMHWYEKGDMVTVEGVSGFDTGSVEAVVGVGAGGENDGTGFSYEASGIAAGHVHGVGAGESARGNEGDREDE